MKWCMNVMNDILLSKISYFEMLWWNIIESIDFIMHYARLILIWYDYVYFCQTEIWNMIVKRILIWDDLNSQPNYVKDPTNGG